MHSTSQALSRPVSPTGSDSFDLDEHITTGVRHRRDYGSDAMQLTPRRTKRLKTEAQQLASDRGIPLKKLVAFIEVQCIIFSHYIISLIQLHAEG